MMSCPIRSDRISMISDLIGSDPIHGWYQIQSDQIRYMDNIGSVILADVTALASGVGTRGGRQQKRRRRRRRPVTPGDAGVRSRPRRRRRTARGSPLAPVRAARVGRRGDDRRTLPPTLASDDTGDASGRSRRRGRRWTTRGGRRW